MIILFQFEECPHSTKVRKRLTALAVDFIAINVPSGQPKKDQVMAKLFGNAKTPGLWETESSTLLSGEDAILPWLDEYYS